MEPWTDGVTPRMEPWTDGVPLTFKSELPLARELRRWSLGLMGCPCFLNQNFLSLANSEDVALD